MDPFLGEIRLMSFNYPPRGWAVCDGTLLPINQNAALFSLLGVTYGGNGQTTFGLPDLRGRTAPGAGSGTAGLNLVQGQTGGEERHTLTVSEMPAHNHPVQAYNGPADTGSTPTPPGATAVLAQAFAVPAGGGGVLVNRYASTVGSEVMASSEVGTSGNGQSHENRQPYLTMNYCIATSGIFPSRQ